MKNCNIKSNDDEGNDYLGQPSESRWLVRIGGVLDSFQHSGVAALNRSPPY